MNRYLNNRMHRRMNKEYTERMPDYARRRRDRMESRYEPRYEDYNYRPDYNYRTMDYRPMEYEIYGYGRPYNSYGSMDYSSGEKEYKEDIKKWIERLKRYDKFGMTMDQLIQHSKQMGVKYDTYSEEEFYATYLMAMSDYKTIGNDPNLYITVAKDFLEDEDSALKGSEKLCAYYYTIIMGDE